MNILKVKLKIQFIREKFEAYKKLIKRHHIMIKMVNKAGEKRYSMPYYIILFLSLNDE